MAQNFEDAANFVFVQLIGQEPDKRHAACARRDKRNFD
jgi:hypothetical protein